MATPIRALEFQYPMIQFSIASNIRCLSHCSQSDCARNAVSKSGAFYHRPPPHYQKCSIKRVIDFDRAILFCATRASIWLQLKTAHANSPRFQRDSTSQAIFWQFVNLLLSHTNCKHAAQEFSTNFANRWRNKITHVIKHFNLCAIHFLSLKWLP